MRRAGVEIEIKKLINGKLTVRLHSQMVFLLGSPNLVQQDANLAVKVTFYIHMDSISKCVL